MAEDAWKWDSAEVPAECWVFRRIKRVRDCYSIEPGAGRVRPLQGGFIYNEGDGMSVSLGCEGDRQNFDVATSLDWSTHAFAAFTAVLVRSHQGMGVIAQPTDSDPSHGLVRAEADPLGRTERRRAWRALRSCLVDFSIWVESSEELVRQSSTRPAGTESQRCPHESDAVDK